MMKDGYEKASTANLPSLSVVSLCRFINEKIDGSFETRGAKLQRSARPDYGDESIGYVQLKREAGQVTLYARVTPEHKVRSKAYTVRVVINEKKDEILEGQCEDCAAAQGGCKNLVAFLFWIHRRSEEPSPTEVACYWKKSRLSTIGDTKFLSLKEICGEKYQQAPTSSSNFLEDLKTEMSARNVVNMISQMSGQCDSISMHHLTFHFKKSSVNQDIAGFQKFCKDLMSPELCNGAEKLTRKQSSSKLWYELRYGRITASILHEAAHCRTDNGSLVNKILGSKSFQTEAMKRGKLLEDDIFKVVADRLGSPISKCGLLLTADYPMFGASPDAVGTDFVVEIKAPASREALPRYITTNGTLTPKYYAQVQLQLYLYKVTKGLFVVADPDFERNKNVETVWVNIDYFYISDLLDKAKVFWGDYVFKFLQIALI